jgi:endoglucanase
MDTWLKDILEQSLLMASPSGSEELITELFAKQVSPYVDEVWTDANGNCIAHKKGMGPKIMFMAHADEVGLMISFIDDRGFLYFNQIGGIDTNILPGLRVIIQGKQGPVTGIIGKKPIHLQSKEESSKALSPEDLWIDIAAIDKADALSKVQIGSVATYESNIQHLSNDMILSKSLDDKIGLAVLMGLARNLQSITTDSDIYLVASVQEELGARGAQMVSEAILPEIGIAIDVTHATDYPTMSPTADGDIRLGKGVVIPLGPNMTKGINQQLTAIAEACQIPYQVEAIAKPTGTDARMIQVAGQGIKTGLVSIPCRYMHTPGEMVSLTDADYAISLLTEYIKNREN